MRTQTDGHFVSVIIPTCGRETLAKVRVALDAQTRPPDEVIVSFDEHRRGTSWARNAGIARSRGDLIVSLDDDNVPPPNWLEAMVSVIDQYGAAVVGGTYTETDPMLAAIRKRRGSMPDVVTVDTGGLVGIGGNTMYRREWLERCYREDGHIYDGLGEDWDLAGRLKQRGALFVFVPVPILHLRRLSGTGFIRFQFVRGRHIAALEHAYRMKRSIPLHPSLLWTQRGPKKWIAIVWKRILGPFDRQGFSTWHQFGLFWFGEKVKSLGYLVEAMRIRLS